MLRARCLRVASPLLVAAAAALPARAQGAGGAHDAHDAPPAQGAGAEDAGPAGTGAAEAGRARALHRAARWLLARVRERHAPLGACWQAGCSEALAVGVLALLRAGAPPDELAAALDFPRDTARWPRAAADVACQTEALCLLEGGGDRVGLDAAVAFLLALRVPRRGAAFRPSSQCVEDPDAWGDEPSHGALHALAAAQGRGAAVPDAVWDEACADLLRRQRPAGPPADPALLGLRDGSVLALPEGEAPRPRGPRARGWRSFTGDGEPWWATAERLAALAAVRERRLARVRTREDADLRRALRDGALALALALVLPLAPEDALLRVAADGPPDALLSLRRAFEALGVVEVAGRPWRDELSRALVSLQADDGSWPGAGPDPEHAQAPTLARTAWIVLFLLPERGLDWPLPLEDPASGDATRERPR